MKVFNVLIMKFKPTSRSLQKNSLPPGYGPAATMLPLASPSCFTNSYRIHLIKLYCMIRMLLHTREILATLPFSQPCLHHFLQKLCTEDILEMVGNTVAKETQENLYLGLWMATHSLHGCRLIGVLLG